MADAKSERSSDVLDLRRAMTHLASGVSVVSTRDVVGRDCALTITSLVSLSLAPPLVLVAVKREGFLHDALTVADGWAVTMLARSQVDLAAYTARHRYPGDTDDFAAYRHVRGRLSDSLYFVDGLAAVECLPEQQVDSGDHTIVVGRVVRIADDCVGSEPLVYHGRAYHSLGDEVPER